MATAKKSKIPTAKLELYEKLIATNPNIERKGDVHPYTSVNGHMFLKKYKATLFEPYGVVKKNYVTVPACSAELSVEPMEDNRFQLG